MVRVIVMMLAMLTAACDWRPVDPSPPDDNSVNVSVVNTHTRDALSSSDQTTPSPSSSSNGSGPTVVVSGSNHEGAPLYRIGPGTQFVRVSGNATTSWCRPVSDCNGQGYGRTGHNVSSPPADWVVDSHAFFRRSGSTGTQVTFTVDGTTIVHNF